MEAKKLSRREFLRLGAMAAAATALAGCCPTPTPETIVVTEIIEGTPVEIEKTVIVEATVAPATEVSLQPLEGTVVVMYPRNELSEDEQAQFEADNPGITIDFVQDDATRRTAMFAAGTPPDFFRTGGGDVPGMLIRKQILNLTPYIDVSPLINVEDLAPANYQYFAEDALHIGTGNIYGMAKDWSAAMTYFVNTEHLQNAGIDVPEDDVPLTFAQIADMARQAVVKEGDRTLVFGYGGDPIEWSLATDVICSLAEQSTASPNPYVGVLYDDLFTKINLTQNEPAREVFKWYFDLQAEGIANSPINPSSAWTGQDFADGKIAIAMEGYWFGAMAETDATRGKVKYLPSARFFNTGKAFDWPTASGSMCARESKVPDLAFRVFEWYHAEEPAIARAKSGWGIPALISQYPLMPQDTEFNQQCYKTLQWELANVDCQTTVPSNPWGANIDFLGIWYRYAEPVLRGMGTFDDMLAQVETEISGLMLDAYNKATG